MGLFAPWFLAGLAGLALPLYLHLLKRQTTTPKPVSFADVLRVAHASSTRHRRLRYFLLLSLRLLLLLLLILAFANPFINRNAAALASNRLVLLVVDNSFSMRAGTRLADAKDAAMSVLSGKGAARAQVAAFGSQLRFMTQPIEDQSALRAAVQAIQPGDGHGNFGELARAVRAMAESVHTPIELHLFSDMQRSELAATFSDMALPANVKLVTHAVVTKAQPNWTVESVDAPGQVWGKDAKPVHVQAVIAGYGTPAAQRTVSLVVNGKTTATKTVAVPANGRATVDFPALEVPYGFNRCEVKIDAADGFPADDLRRFAVERSDPQKALLIHNYGDNRSPLYVGAALSAAAQSAFILESINVNEAADRQPSNYAFIVLSDLNTLPSLLENSLTGYVRSGGSLLIAAGTSAGGRSQIPIFGAHINSFFLQGDKIDAPYLQGSHLNTETDVGIPSGYTTGDGKVARFFAVITGNSGVVDLEKPQMFIKQDSGARTALAVYKPHSGVGQVLPGGDVFGVVLGHVKTFKAGDDVDDHRPVPGENSPNVRYVVGVGVTVPQVGGNGVGAAAIKGK